MKRMTQLAAVIGLIGTLLLGGAAPYGQTEPNSPPPTPAARPTP